jgi:16S rRNA processing protein RimM
MGNRIKMTSAGTDTGDFVLLGKVTKPHGIRGEVKVYPYSGQPENFLNYREVFFALSEDDNWIPYTIEKSRVQGNQVLLKLKNCTTRSGAEELVGREIWLDRQDLPELEDDEYYWFDFVGKGVVTDDGNELGKVTGVLETGAHGILVVTDKNQEYLIPVINTFIVRVDDKEVVLKLPTGLLEINRK